MDELPQLPPTSWVDVPHFTYTAADMRAYAAAAVAQERERCASVLRYWLAGYAADTVASHEARCLAHILDGRSAPEHPATKDKP